MLNKMMLSSLPVLALVAMFSSSLPSAAATLTVTSTADDSTSGTLRSRVAAAQSGDTIDFSVTGTIILSQGQILLDKDLTIAGPGVDLLSIDGNGLASRERIFEITSDVDIEITGLTLEHGGTQYELDISGGGILNNGALSLREVTIQNNAARRGGGIYNGASGILNIWDSALTDNGASFPGACTIHNDGGTVRVTRTMLTDTNSDDSRPCEGSLIVNESGHMALSDSITMTGDLDDDPSGARSAIQNQGDLRINRSTQQGACVALSNSGSAEIVESQMVGGLDERDCGIINLGLLWVTDSVVRDFTSYSNGGIINNGTAILDRVLIDGNTGGPDGNSGIVNRGSLLVVNSTVRPDQAYGEYSVGLFAAPGSNALIFSSTFADTRSCCDNSKLILLLGGNVTIANSVLSMPDSGEPTCGVTAGTLKSLGGNIASDSSCNTHASEGTFLVQDPLLGPLQDNGGPTLTYALLPGSPAIDFATNCTYDDDLDPLTPEVPLPSDQRGWLRPAGLACDSGAYESNSVPLPRVTGHRVLDCTAQQEIATLVNGENFTVDLADVATPACLGVGVLMEANAPSGDGSVGHDYIPAVGEVVTSPYQGENNEPFAMMGDSGWVVPGEIAACHCDSPDRGDLTHPGVHVITSTPCSADTVSWTAGDKAAQCEASGGLAGLAFTTSLEVVPEPSFGLMLLFGAGALSGLTSRRR